MVDALRFLTVLPLGRSGGAPTTRSLIFFPVVGLVVGGVWLVPALVFSNVFGSAGVVAALVLLADAVVTGGLHLDALADVADGVGSRRSGDEAIAVMRDPTIGALGAAALILVCLLRYGALTFSVDFGFRLLAAPVAGRAAMVCLIAVLPPRQDGSLAHVFADPSRWVLLGAAVASLVCVVPSGPRGGVALGLAVLSAVVYGAWWRERFGELSGDGVGAGGLIAETVALLALAAH